MVNERVSKFSLSIVSIGYFLISWIVFHCLSCRTLIASEHSLPLAHTAFANTRDGIFIVLGGGGFQKKHGNSLFFGAIFVNNHHLLDRVMWLWRRCRDITATNASHRSSFMYSTVLSRSHYHPFFWNHLRQFRVWCKVKG
jgi:hypothetical protein